MTYERRRASPPTLNNGGLEEQIRYLVEGLGSEYAERQLDELIEERAKEAE